MAINPESQYPGKVAPASAAYPYGEAQNITEPGDGTGTPWDATLVNDLFGFQQALLSKASVPPSGNSETASSSQYLEALQRLGVFLYDSTRVYRAGEFVRTSTRIYKSADNGNQGNDPDTDGGVNWEQVTEKQPTTQIFTSGGTWTKPSGCVRVSVTVVGGGGAGGGAEAVTTGQASVGSGGNGAGAASKTIDVTAISSETVTVGAGGAGVSGAQGGDGGSSSFGAHASVPGGLGGRTTGASGGLRNIDSSGGATAGSGGDLNLTGGPGGNGMAFGATAISTGGASSGQGGSAALLGSGGGRSVRSSGGDFSFDGNIGGDYGAGGSGGSSSAANTSAAAAAGGNGAGGIVIVKEYYA